MECTLGIFRHEKWLIQQVAALPLSGILRGCWSGPVGNSRHEWEKIDVKPYPCGARKHQAPSWTGWGLTDWKAALQKRLQGSWWTPSRMWAIDFPLRQTASSCHPPLEYHQQVKGWFFSAMLSTSGILCPSLGCPVKGRLGHAGARPMKGCKDAEEIVASDTWKAKRDGIT